MCGFIIQTLYMYIYSTYFIFIINRIPFLGISISACLSIKAPIFHWASDMFHQGEQLGEVGAGMPVLISIGLEENASRGMF